MSKSVTPKPKASTAFINLFAFSAAISVASSSVVLPIPKTFAPAFLMNENNPIILIVFY